MRVICALLVFLSHALVSAQVLKNYTVGESSFPDCPRETERNGLQKRSTKLLSMVVSQGFFPL